ncbi:hypothetical protein QBC42DRAFT_259296 [Cladorrhinum samala]|uniref:Cell wall protein PhiA n=1 Tax=Cladorrhinum samala TaxID=585594 RepID=A0AAV9I3N6_9PEZI|nr:hypothetical protein QBC42DRAFT_259296 [Cladorrhinum samala]
MQLTTALLSVFAAAAAAAPATEGASCTPPPRRFGIMALRSASPIHFGEIIASENKMALGLAESEINAQCADGAAKKEATFYIRDGELFLYTPNDTVQQFFTDRSGMGQGVIQYVTYKKGETPNFGARSETKGWVVDENDNLTFNGNSLQACPWDPATPNATKWYIWMSGVEKPAGQEGCLGFNARTVTTAKPVQCTYSQRV